jgi:hydroxymethylpyrimidine/phosphomethylpyrimidine kinase
MNNTQRPVVVSFSGHDPCGGAGIQADIEAITSHHCHAASIITCLTEQDTRNVAEIVPQNPDNLIRQAKTLLRDLPVHAFKIGLIGHADTVQVIYDIIRRHPLIPVILDPILAAGGGAELANEDLISSMRELLLPHTTVLTPNCAEARRLTGLEDIEACGTSLFEKFGCEYVLITGADVATEKSVTNYLFHDNHRDNYTWERLPSNYHGSGCTLAASIAALFAHGVPPLRAISNAQEYTWNCLKAAYKTGAGQSNPNRFFWRDE